MSIRMTYWGIFRTIISKLFTIFKGSSWADDIRHAVERAPLEQEACYVIPSSQGIDRGVATPILQMRKMYLWEDEPALWTTGGESRSCDSKSALSTYSVC